MGFTCFSSKWKIYIKNLLRSEDVINTLKQLKTWVKVKIFKKKNVKLAEMDIEWF